LKLLIMIRGFKVRDKAEDGFDRGAFVDHLDAHPCMTGSRSCLGARAAA